MKLKYTIVTGILISALLFISFIVKAQSKQDIVLGTVKSESGETLIGVSVAEVDKNNRYIGGEVTDFNGDYVLKVSNRENRIVFSYIGFKSHSQVIGNSSLINVVLKEDVTQIEDVVVKAERVHSDGTFNIPTREISTASQTISTKEFEGLAVSSIDDALQGRIAGLDIVANSGDLGSGTTMRIRGTSSINGNSEPLIVLDGVPFEVETDPNFDFANANQEQFATMLSLNPDDIEEITVLKDAAASAIWGSKGANGVLVIKTKKGYMGPTRVQYSYRFSASQLPQGLKMLNGDEYSMMIKQAYFNPKQNENAANVREFLYDPTFSEFENYNNNTDWVDAVTQIGFKHDHYLTVSGGGERARFRVSGGVLNQSGTVIGQNLSRLSTRANLDYKLSDKIRFITQFSFTYTDNDQSYDNLLGIAYRKMPNLSIYDQDVEGNDTDAFYSIPRNSGLHEDQRDLMNPVALAHLATNNVKNYRILPTFRLKYDLLNPATANLQYNMYLSFDVNNSKRSMFLPREVSNNTWNDEMVNRAEGTDYESITVLTDQNLTWHPTFGNEDHSLILYGSVQVRTGNTANQGITTRNIPSNELKDPSVDGSIKSLYTSRSQYRSNALLFRGHYTYKDRYILTATFRRDGNTRFGDDHKYGNFPGLSLKWILSDEDFMRSTDYWLSMLAIRPSWGITGNPPDEEYLHFSRYSAYGRYTGLPATRPTTLQLSDLRWETTTQYNFGVDVGLFDDKVLADINFYNKVTEDLLFENLNIPSTSGYGNVPWQNVGTMRNNGWEFNISSYKLLKFGKATLDFNFNLSNFVNTLEKLRDDVLHSYNGDFNYENGSYLTRIQEGNSYGSIYGFKYEGVYQYNDYIPGEQEDAPIARDENGVVFSDENGDPLPMYFAYGQSNAYQFRGGDAKYTDINNDGSIDELDIVYLGNSNPKVNGGFGSTFRYKNFGATAFFNFRYGNKIVNAARMNAENMYGLNNQSKTVNWRWRKDGDVTNIPRALYDSGYNWLGSDRYIEEGSFLRLKNVTLSYSVPKKNLKKYSIENLNFYLTLDNLAVFTKYTGVDPEVSYGSIGVSTDNAQTPRSRNVNFSVSVTF